jgi:hypothetical protein
MRIISAVFSLLVVFIAPLQAQHWEVPYNEFGQPDLQGLWTNPWMTPLQRPIELGERRTYTDAEVEMLVTEALQSAGELDTALDPNRPPPAAGGTIDQTADGNFETMPLEVARVNGEWRTSYVIQPEDGRLPYKDDIQDVWSKWSGQGLLPSAGPEARGALDRCLSGPSPVPLLTLFGGPVTGNPGGDNPVRNIQIIQTANYVAILSEYFSQVRIIRLDSKFSEHQMPRWMGDSIGHYDGSSLVVRSRNFRSEQSSVFMRSSDAFQLEEIYTPLGEDALLLRYTVTDPKIYSETFTAEIPLRRMLPDHQIYEYGCHEGNYSMSSILRAARMEELGLLD